MAYVLGDPIVSIGELEQACREMSNWPDDMDEVFILCFDFHYESDGAEGNFFRFHMTTKRLLSQMEESHTLCTDATYKVSVNIKKKIQITRFRYL